MSGVDVTADPAAPTNAEEPAVSDAEFMENVREARANGETLVCALCGIGSLIPRHSDVHATACPDLGPTR